MLDFQVSTIVFTVINLLVLYFILRKLLFGRVNAVLEQRAARVKETIDSAEASKSQAEELRAEYEDKLTDEVFSRDIVERLRQDFTFLLPYYDYFVTLEGDPDPRDAAPV